MVELLNMICKILTWILWISIIAFAAGGICDAILDITHKSDDKEIENTERNARLLILYTQFMEAMNNEDYATAREIYYEYFGEDEDEEEDIGSNWFIDHIVRPVFERIGLAIRFLLYGFACYHLRVKLLIYNFIHNLLHG